MTVDESRMLRDFLCLELAQLMKDGGVETMQLEFDGESFRGKISVQLSLFDEPREPGAAASAAAPAARP